MFLNKIIVVISLILLFFILGFTGGYLLDSFNAPHLFSSPYEDNKIQVCFSPQGNCERLILKIIQSARKKILIHAYSFTSESIANALICAINQGIDVQILCDKDQLLTSRSVIPRLKAQGAHIIIDTVRGTSHNKVIIIDERWVLTGSYNFTDMAQRLNAENIIFIPSPSLAKIYKNNWYQRVHAAGRAKL